MTDDKAESDTLPKVLKKTTVSKECAISVGLNEQVNITPFLLISQHYKM